MRSFLSITLTGVLVIILVSPMRADDADKAKAIIDKAIKAIGGRDKFDKVNAETWKDKGTYYGNGQEIPYTGNYAVQWPHQFRVEIEGFITIVLDGDKGWTQRNGETKEMDKEELARNKEDVFANSVMTLTPLQDKGFMLAPLGEIQVDNKPAVGVRVSHKDHKDVSLYFDKDSGLLIKSERRTQTGPEQGNMEVNQETFYSDYKDVDGIKVPMKFVIKRDGKQFVEAEHIEVKLVDKLDGKVFAKP
jgi:hypothetical protein